MAGSLLAEISLPKLFLAWLLLVIMPGNVRIVSAPSPVMEFTNDKASCFYIHRVAIVAECRLDLLAPERIEIPGEDDMRA